MSFSSSRRIWSTLAAAILILSIFRLLPKSVHIRAIRRQELVRSIPKWLVQDPKDIFSYIYDTNIWGSSTGRAFFSGAGSHDPKLIDPYISAVRDFISDAFTTPPDVVDLGCGDFNIGQQIRNVTGQYTACDVVPDLIHYNQHVFSQENVNFQVLDITTEEPPAGDIVFIRQVLQHLNNERVAATLSKLKNRYTWAIITDHIPLTDPFTSNLDIPNGYIRLKQDSGLVLPDPPFNFEYYSAAVLCEVMDIDGRIRTTAYQLKLET